MKQLFITGMMRSGTSLIQTLLTNHPDIFVAHQPYYSFYLGVRKLFLESQNIHSFLALGDGLDCPPNEGSLFKTWLEERYFNTQDVARLREYLLDIKGEYDRKFYEDLKIKEGTFFEIQKQLYQHLASCFEMSRKYIGIKEIFCESYLSALNAASIKSILIIRDPRAVIASARNGAYVKLIGDRYPLLMLLRLWRKSATFWCKLKKDQGVYTIKYEDLIRDPFNILAGITTWLGVEGYDDTFLKKPLLDYKGEVWKGNSSFGDKIGVQFDQEDCYRSILSEEEIRFIEACTAPEMELLNYQYNSDLAAEDITFFSEDESAVRESYLVHYKIDDAAKALERLRWKKFKP